MDIRLESFLAVYKHRSYTLAAEELCLTQPAVTQHIQFLEQKYQSKLIIYSNKKLTITRAGEILYTYAQNLKANEKNLIEQLQTLENEKTPLKFAATLTIGEFSVAPILEDFCNFFSDHKITLYVDNTQTIIKLLNEGEIKFALVEGLFNKEEYQTTLIKMVDFILIVSPTHHLSQKDVVTLDDIKNETLIVREKGSGSRDILERGLFDRNFTLKSFNSVMEIGNVNVIKRLVKDKVGISFMYQDAAKKELENGELSMIDILNFRMQREYNFLCRKDEMDRDLIGKSLAFFKEKLGS